MSISEYIEAFGEAAPFWDMSFPSALKVFFENMSLFGVTFDSNEKECYGLCKAEKVMYITTDYSTPDEIEKRIDMAIKEGLEICEEF